MTGDAWVAARFRPYTALAAAGIPAMGAIGLEQLAHEGLQMRQVLRSPAFGGREIQTTVLSVREEPANPDLTAVPVGYEPGGELSGTVR
jgi:hypothetical protein